MSTNGVPGPEPAATITATLAIPPNALRVVAPPPDTISQRNVEAVTGIPSHVYLVTVRDRGFPLPVTRLGKLRIVNRAAFVAWLERGAFSPSLASISADATTTPAAAKDGDDTPEEADDILEAVGFRQAPAPAGRRTSRRR